MLLVIPMGATGCDFDSEETPVVIAHRGASAVAPENTEASLREAVRLGARVIELDVRVTRDGVLALFHDDVFDRLAGCRGSIETSDWAEVRILDVGKWFAGGAFAGERVVRLEEALRICLDGGATALIERKTGSASQYAAVIDSLDAADHVIVQSFDWQFLDAFRIEMPDARIGALGWKDLDVPKQALLENLRPDWVGWHHLDLNEADLGTLKQLGMRVALWTVNDPEVAAAWVAKGVDAIITDVPDVISGRLRG